MNIKLPPFPSKSSFILKLFFIFFMIFIFPAFAAVTITTVDTGSHPSLVLNNQGYPVISYYDRIQGNLNLAVCGNPTCTSGNILTPVDNIGPSPDGRIFGFSSLVLNKKGHPVISYTDYFNSALKIAVCSDSSCTSNKILTIVDSPLGFLDSRPSLALNNQSHPVISYKINSLLIAVCSNPTCTSTMLATVDKLGGTWRSSLVFNAQDYPVISYDNDDYNVPKLKLAVCGNPTCTSGNSQSTIDRGSSPFLALNKQGYPVISYYDNIDQKLKIAVCGDFTCTSNVLTTVYSVIGGSAGDGSGISSLVLDDQDHPVVSFGAAPNFDLKLLVCGNPTCTAGNVLTTIDNMGAGWRSSLALNNQGYPVISYDDNINKTIKLAVCDTPTCSDTPHLTLQGNGHPIPSGNSTPTLLGGTDFGSRGIGDMLTHAFTLKNQGGGNLDLTLLTLTDCASFALTLPPLFFTLAPNKATTFQLTFSPTTLGIFTCLVRIESNDPDKNPYTFFVQGQGQIK